MELNERKDDEKGNGNDEKKEGWEMKVRIIGSGSERLWYADRIGEVFDVIEDTNYFDVFLLECDVTTGYAPGPGARFIKKDDGEIVEEGELGDRQLSVEEGEAILGSNGASPLGTGGKAGVDCGASPLGTGGKPGTCGECRFWERRAVGVGFCRRWPKTMPKDESEWCGEWGG